MTATSKLIALASLGLALLLGGGCGLWFGHWGRCTAVAGAKGQNKGKEGERPIHTA